MFPRCLGTTPSLQETSLDRLGRSTPTLRAPFVPPPPSVPEPEAIGDRHIDGDAGDEVTLPDLHELLLALRLPPHLAQPFLRWWQQLHHAFVSAEAGGVMELKPLYLG